VSNLSRRRSAVSAAVAAVGGMLITTPANVRYLTGFAGTNGWLLLTPGGGWFLTDPRYAEQAAKQVEDASIEVSSDGLPRAAGDLIGKLQLRRVGFEPAHVTVAVKEKLDAAADVEWVPLRETVETQRRTKDEGEITAVCTAMALTEAALEEVVATMAPGNREAEVAAELERACRRRGAERMAFDTIVASGPRSALPHGVASQREIRAGEPVMIDMGCQLDGYCSDLTRMIWCGGVPDARWLEIHLLVDRARAAAVEAVRSGVEAAAVDAAARAVITAAGYGEAFSHGTGHGVGLEIHEAPKLSSRSSDRLESGMLVTIEPAVYLEGEFGVRIEDLVRVTDDGCERLTTLNTEPILREIS